MILAPLHTNSINAHHPPSTSLMPPPSYFTQFQNASSSALSSSSRSATTAYDAKFVTLEMLRHGTLGHPVQLPGLSPAFAGLANSAANTLASASALALPSTAISNVTVSSSGMSLGHGHGHSHGHSGGSGSSSSSDGSAWAQLHVHVLPLFNNQLLQAPMYVPSQSLLFSSLTCRLVKTSTPLSDGTLSP